MTVVTSIRTPTPLVPLQDRRALVSEYDASSVDHPRLSWVQGTVAGYRKRRFDALQRRPYRDGALRPSQSDWTLGPSSLKGRDSPPAWDSLNTTQQSMNETTNSLFSVRSSMRDSARSRPMSPSEGAGLSMDSLYKSGTSPPRVPPSKDNVHNSECYEAHVRPWRHDLGQEAREPWRASTELAQACKRFATKTAKEAPKGVSAKPTRARRVIRPWKTYQYQMIDELHPLTMVDSDALRFSKRQLERGGQSFKTWLKRCYVSSLKITRKRQKTWSTKRRPAEFFLFRQGWRRCS